MAKEIKEVKAAKPAKATKTPNPESFFNKFAKPVGKLGLVGALTAGAIGFVNELTKDAIATNWYEFSLSSYMEMGDSIEGWERDDTNFNIVTEGTSGTVTEYMVYCDTAQAEDCTVENDMVGIAFKAEANHGGYGNMIFQVTVNKDAEMVAYNQLGFVTSFGKQSGIILDDLDKMVADKMPLDAGSFVSGASTGVTIKGIQSMITDMKTTYQAVAVDPAVTIKEDLLKLHKVGNLDGVALEAMIDDTTEVKGDYTDNSAIITAKLADGTYIVKMGFTQEYSAAQVIFHIQSDGTFTWDKRSGGFISADYFNEQGVIDKLNTGETTSIEVMTSTVTGASTETAAGAKTMIEDLKAIWADKGGFA